MFIKIFAKKKKKIIIGIGGIVVITSAIVIPVVVIVNNNNNEEKNKEDVEAIIKILKSKSNSQKTLILEGNSIGKIINNNKSKIITKIKKLIGVQKLKGVKFDVSLENDVDISTTEKFIIVTVKKEKYSQQLKGKNGLKVKRAKNVQEIKIDTIKEYLNNLDNLNLTLPKTNYSNDNEILIAIRKLLATQINNIEIDDTNLITKKENSNEIVSVVTHNDEETTPYEITINDEDFTLNLNQEEFSEDEKNVKNIKQLLESLTLKEITIDESSGSITTNKNSILEKLQALSGYPLDLKGVTISIKEEETEITPIGVTFIIKLSKGSVNQELKGFIVKRSQSQTEINQNDVDEIKQSLESLISKEVIITTKSGSITTNKNSILGKLQALNSYPSDLKGVTISIKEEETEITPIGVTFIIELSKGSVNKELRSFIVKRSQSQAEIDQNDINEVERLLNTLTSKEITIDASSGSITTNKNSILEKLQALSGYPLDLKGVIVSIKEEETKITPIGVAFIIKLSKGSVNQELRGFTVKRNQTPIEKIENNIKKYLKIPINLNIILPKDKGSDYNEDSKILAAIRKKLEILTAIRKQFEILKTFYPKISKNDFDNLITKKQPSSQINSIATHDTINPTEYKITIGNEDFTLKLKQDQFTKEEKIINNIKTYLENEENLNIMLPKTTYDNDDDILEAIRLKLVNDIEDISSSDSNLINKKQDSTPIIEVATHNAETSTQYIITVGGKDFTLKLNQDELTPIQRKRFRKIKLNIKLQINPIINPTKKIKFNDDEKGKALEILKRMILKKTTFNDEDSYEISIIKRRKGKTILTLLRQNPEPEFIIKNLILLLNF